MSNGLRTIWGKFFKFDYKFGVFLFVLICIPRFFIVLQANVSHSYNGIAAVMLVSAILPFIFLNKEGRKTMGLVRTNKFSSLFLALIAGVGIAILLHYLGQMLYHNTNLNWYYYIGQSYNISSTIAADERLIMFALMAVSGMLYSPIGEEFFFRGMIYSSFQKSTSVLLATMVSCAAFALVHISHFGILYIDGQWSFPIVPTLVWTAAMFALSWACLYFRASSKSIWGAVCCHSGFNFGMILSIFYLL